MDLELIGHIPPRRRIEIGKLTPRPKIISNAGLSPDKYPDPEFYAFDCMNDQWVLKTDA